MFCDEIFEVSVDATEKESFGPGEVTCCVLSDEGALIVTSLC